MSGLANGCFTAKRNEKAAELGSDVADQMKTAFGLDHRNTIATMSNLAFAYQASDRREDALAVQSEILQIQTKKFGVEHPTTLILMRNLAGNYLKLDRPEDALSILEECLTIRTKLHPSSWKTFEVQSDLGEALFKLDRIEEAIPNLKEGYEGLNQNAEKIPLSSRKNKLKKALLRLRELAESQEQPTEFTKWQQELDSLDSTKESR